MSSRDGVDNIITQSILDRVPMCSTEKNHYQGHDYRHSVSVVKITHKICFGTNN